MSLDANSWRYENMKTRHGINSLRNWEILKIKRDNNYYDREDAVTEMKKDAFKSYWRENLEHRSNSDMIKMETKQKKGEITMSRKASMLVRKAALKKLLDDEYCHFQLELNQQNKSFYIKRE